jgi:hypothetical protein
MPSSSMASEARGRKMRAARLLKTAQMLTTSSNGLMTTGLYMIRML